MTLRAIEIRALKGMAYDALTKLGATGVYASDSAEPCLILDDNAGNRKIVARYKHSIGGKPTAIYLSGRANLLTIIETSRGIPALSAADSRR